MLDTVVEALVVGEKNRNQIGSTTSFQSLPPLEVRERGVDDEVATSMLSEERWKAGYDHHLSHFRPV